MPSKNANLNEAKKNKNDEFYTFLDDIENEVTLYKEYFNNKIVYMPCDTLSSNFWIFFKTKFDEFNLKKIIATSCNDDGTGVYNIYTKEGIISGMLEDGDLFGPSCGKYFDECDIVCTNPPFSVFRDFITLLNDKGKDYLIIGNQNAFTYQEVFPLIKNNLMKTGYNKVKTFSQPDGTVKKFGNVCWFSNLALDDYKPKLSLTNSFDVKNYPFYENCSKAINVDRVNDIPNDYKGIMGVPITFLDKYNPTQFKILGLDKEFTNDRGRGIIYGQTKYARVFIQRIDI